MNNSILMAIESMCDDIATSTNADDNKKRAEAIVSLAFGGLFTPEDCEDEELAGETAQDSEARKTMPQAGEHFNYNGMEFIVLGKEQGGILAVAAKCLEDEMPFDEDNCNDWRKSSLRRYLNEEYIKGFNRGDLLPFVSDLTTDSGQKDYGTSEDYIALLSCDLYRKYREYVPKYDNWVWTLTPWHIFPSNAYSVRFVYTDGSMNSNYANTSYGVAAACIFNPKIFE